MLGLHALSVGNFPTCELAGRGVAGLWEVAVLAYGERLLVRRFEGCSLDTFTTAVRETDGRCDVREGWRDGKGVDIGWESGVWIVVNQYNQEMATGSCYAADAELGLSNNAIKSATYWPHPIQYTISPGGKTDFTSTTFDDSYLVQHETWEAHCHQLYRARHGIPDIEVRSKMDDDILSEFRDPVEGAPAVPPYCHKILGIDEAGYGSLQHLAPPDVRNMTLQDEIHEDVAYSNGTSV